MKKWLNIFLSFILIATLVGTNFSFAAVADNAGTEADPYLIYDYEDFLRISEEPSAHYKLMEDITIPESYNMIDNFNGSLDGQNHSIKLNINMDSNESIVNIGLFRIIDNSIIKNLNLRGTIYIQSIINTNVGGLAGKANGSVILSNIKNFISVENIASDNTATGTAGIIGDTSSCNLTITNCNNYANIKGSNYVAGLIGKGYNSSTSLNIKFCYNFGNIFSSYFYAAGIIGSTPQNVPTAECLGNYGDIKASRYAAGLISKSYVSTISQCFNYGNIESASSAAGLISTISRNISISNCYNAGEIKSTNKASGIIGSISSSSEDREVSVNSCYNIGILESPNSYNIYSNPTYYSKLYGLEEYYRSSYESKLNDSNIKTLFINNNYFILDTTIQDHIILKNNKPILISYYKDIRFKNTNGITISSLDEINDSNIVIEIDLYSTEKDKSNFLYIVSKFDLNGSLLEVTTSNDTTINITYQENIDSIEVFGLKNGSLEPIHNSQYFDCITVLK